MPQTKALLTPKGGLRLAWCVIEAFRRAAERFQVSIYYRRALGARNRTDGGDGIEDLSGRPASLRVSQVLPRARAIILQRLFTYQPGVRDPRQAQIW